MTLKEKSEILAEQKNIKNVMGWLLVSIRADYKEVRKEDEDNQK